MSRRDTRESIIAKIGLVALELQEQERELPFEFRADEELFLLARGQVITNNDLENVVRAFLNRPAVRVRLKLFRRLARLERRLAVFDRIV
ncbi:MAG: hypothetical protein UX09_C0016G0013 [Candidatus Uhrbacteria bacterium GW2011_GWE2_45_35]|uniref:Uncharacterized protein n=2 Tax=Candidatus Uhriibacteriota TaxID=1752732 RepID=A0A0G1MID6_9BACT|nr:MAG: hypothetical protein UW63_C0009G0008 [Candidatus Uhrbacteria bacterium GW2011_GWF2_44_350]KKU08549.1 MAG: hypothetical protein UX09_C0016G0013 [Candidatus Uhrbacteria bacterium GW2011_GWE2_45_35]HBR80053.1 hypothetical protein [Candidatus Uhrbacteria bacterium]HCU31127.1 hypothetical protein [Candidatus Uhrbacteria bacterium]